eukprot:CAMPEP_0204563600 /NCGR_PEP_ID=MMETSP0661-20131031/34404_1 /ASSEMBLY_ACC=CAM_ASM_000606 /TAXON_ID=109239 /ORGANISM="Alexandrium margalefi, Strain AMGDE01CS-322" /LENGTH=185 /DNA_ID=CAMNT_0051571171 /DNA_START=241 /DNA_END=795 /DNA_ORIENTATION=-
MVPQAHAASVHLQLALKPVILVHQLPDLLLLLPQLLPVHVQQRLHLLKVARQGGHGGLQVLPVLPELRSLAPEARVLLSQLCIGKQQPLVLPRQVLGWRRHSVVRLPPTVHDAGAAVERARGAEEPPVQPTDAAVDTSEMLESRTEVAEAGSNSDLLQPHISAPAALAGGEEAGGALRPPELARR